VIDGKKIIIGGEQFGMVDWGSLKVNQLCEAFNRFIDFNVKEVDTSNIYGLGRSEILLGELINKHRNGKEIKIATKVGLVPDNASNPRNRSKIIKCGTPSCILKSLEQSLKNLKLDQIDTLYLHYVDPNVPITTSLKSIKELKASGIIAKVGLCNWDPSIILSENNRVLSTIDRYQTLLNPITYIENPSFYQTLIKKLREANIELIAYSPLNRGMLAPNFFQKYNEMMKNESDRRSRLKNFKPFHKEIEIAKKIHNYCEKSSLQVNIVSYEFLLNYIQVDKIIAGVKKPSHVDSIFNQYKIPEKLFSNLFSSITNE